MPITSVHNLPGSDKAESQQNLSQVFFRLWPYLPMLFIALILGIGISYFYLRNATKHFAAHAEMVVNDNTLNKGNNLELRDSRQNPQDQVSEVEKQIEILKSNNLLGDVVKELKFHIRWSPDASFDAGTTFKPASLDLELITPDSVTAVEEGIVKMSPDHKSVEFNGVVYPADSVIQSSMGSIRWKVPGDSNQIDNKEIYLRVLPVPLVAEHLEERFTVSPLSKESSILMLSVVDEIPDRSLQILRSIIGNYEATTLGEKKKILENTLNFIDDRLGLVSTDLKSVESSLRNFKSRGGITDLTTEGQIYLGQVKENDQKLSEIEVQLNVLNNLEDYLSQRNQSANAPPATLGLSDQVLVTLLSQLFQDEFELEKIEKLSGEKNSQAIILRDRIEKRRSSILESVRNLRKSLEVSKSALLANNGSFNRSLRSIPEKEMSLLNLTRDQGIKNELYTFLLRKREETAIAAAAIEPNFKVIQRPFLFGQVKPKPLLIYCYGVLAALLLSGLWIYKKEFASSRILYLSDIENNTEIPVIGEIIFEPAAADNQVIIGSESRTLVAEQFRELRANIHAALRREENGKVLMMTSSVPGEGKTFISINLAVSLAFSGKKTALVEFDLYQPKVCEGLGISCEFGITDYFLGKETPENIAHPYSKVNNLWIIPAGTPQINPAELILNGRLPALFEHLKNEFDYIVVDSPAVGMVTDTKILASYSSLSLYVIRQRYAHIGFLRFLNSLKQTGALSHLRIIFNGVKIKKAPGLNYWDSYGYNGYRYGNNNPYTKSEPRKKKYRIPKLSYLGKTLNGKSS